jgi:hypothetical protein
MNGDTITGYLPYYGERYNSGGYNNKIAIEFNGIPLNKEIKWNEQKRRAEMRFRIYQKDDNDEMRFRIYQKDDNELYDIFIMIFSNKTTRIDVNSSERSLITYEGAIKTLLTQ